LFRLDGFVSGTALGIQELKQLPKYFRVGGIPQECALTTNEDKVFASEFFKVMRQGGIWNIQFFLNLSDD
jgi:hypothetical protein